MLSEYLARGIGEKGEEYMKSKIEYTEGPPMGNLKVVEDFLPPPERLVLKEENVKVTISLKKTSVDFFKKEAKKHHISYQKMIRQLIDWYSTRFQGNTK